MTGLMIRSALCVNVLWLWFSLVQGKTPHQAHSESGIPSYENDLLSQSYENEAINCSSYVMEQEYIILENGSLLLPDSKTIYDYNNYFVQNDTAFLCSGDVVSTESSGYDFSKEFLSCTHFLLDSNEFRKLNNDSIYVDIYFRMYGPRDYYISDQGVYVCRPLFDEIHQNTTSNSTNIDTVDKFSDYFTYVTYVGLLISIISLLAHLTVFCLLSTVRNLPGCCLASLSVSLLMAYFCFMSVALVDTTEQCANLGMGIYYFFLASFFWMNVIAFDVWRSFRVVMRELRISSHKVPRRRFLLYSSYSWLIPAILTGFVKLFDSTDLLPEELRPSFGEPKCWFGQRKPLLIFFAVPLIIVMLLNAVFFIDVAFVINRHSLKTSHSQEVTLKKRFFMFMRLGLIMGLTWIVGLVAGLVSNEILWYLFIVLNTLQGLFIFVVFSCSSKIRAMFCKRYRNSRKKSTSSSVRTMSQAI